MQRIEPYPPSVRKTIGMFFSVAISLALLFALFAFVADRFLFRPEPYQAALNQYHFPQLFPRLVAELIVGKQPPDDPVTEPPGSLSEPGSQIKYLNVDDYETILGGMMPQDWVRSQTETTLGQFFDFLNLKTKHLQLRVSLETVKSNLAGETGNAIALQVIHSWPDCTPEWLSQVAVDAVNGDLQGTPTCRPPDEYLNLVEPVVQSSLSSLAQNMPDQIDLVQIVNLIRLGTFRYDEMSAASSQGGPQMPVALQTLRWVMRLSPLIVIWLLIMLTLTAVRSWNDLLTYWGGAILAAGGLGVILSLFAGMPLVSSAVNRFGDQASQVVSRNLIEIISLALQAVLQRYFLWVGITAGILTLIGAGMVIASVLRKRNI